MKFPLPIHSNINNFISFINVMKDFHCNYKPSDSCLSPIKSKHITDSRTAPDVGSLVKFGACFF